MRKLMKCLVLCVTALMVMSSVKGQEMATANGTLIVLNKSDAAAILISLKTGKAVTTLPTGEGPHEVGVSRDGKTAVITNYGLRQQPGSSLTVINLQQCRVIKTIELETGCPPKFD